MVCDAVGRDVTTRALMNHTQLSLSLVTCWNRWNTCCLWVTDDRAIECMNYWQMALHLLEEMDATVDLELSYIQDLLGHDSMRYDQWLKWKIRGGVMYMQVWFVCREVMGTGAFQKGWVTMTASCASLQPKICSHSDPPLLKSSSAHNLPTDGPNLHVQYLLITLKFLTVRASDKSSIIANRKSTTCFQTSYRWTSYVSPNYSQRVDQKANSSI